MQKAVEWTAKSAEQGLAEAMDNLGLYYYNGYGVKKDDETAIYWWKKAAELGNQSALRHLQKLGL